jgi:GT2 family glycosyltransferase
VIKLERNYGYAKGVNLATRFARGEIIGVLNTDMFFPDTDWLKKIVSFMMLHPENWVVSPLLLYNDEKIDSAGGASNILMIGWDMLSQRELARINLSRPYRVFSPPGAAFFFRRKLLNKLGRIFDDDYFAYYEDADLGLRVNSIGGAVVILPYVFVIHKRSRTWGWASPEKFYYLRRNSIVTGIKFFPLRALLLLLPTWFMSTFFASFLYYKIVRNPLFLFVTFKVVFSIIKDLNVIMKKRYASLIPVSKMLFSKILILPNTKHNFFIKIGIAFVNIMVSLAGLKHFKLTYIEKYPLFDLWSRGGNNE